MSTTFRQQERGIMAYPQSGWRKLMFRWPIVLWRLGLAPLIGRSFLLLTTTGRKSGRPRRAMLEYHTLGSRRYITSAWGARADWYRNITASPNVTVQSARGTEAVLAQRIVADDELTELYEFFRRRAPAYLNWYLQSLAIQPDRADFLAKKDHIYWLRLDPTDEPTPPALPADLLAVWLLPLAAGLGLCFFRRGRNVS